MLQKFNPHWRFPFYIRPTLYIKDIKFQKIIHFIGHHLIGIYCLIIISALVTSMEYYSWIQNSKSVLYYFWNSDCMIAFYGHSTSELQITVPNQPWFSEHWSAFHYLPFSCFPNSSCSWKPCFCSFLSTPENNFIPRREGDHSRLPFCVWIISLTVTSSFITCCCKWYDFILWLGWWISLCLYTKF